jgi:protein SCO1/2
MRVKIYLIALSFLLVTACTKQPSAETKNNATLSPSISKEKRFPLFGEVLSINLSTNTLTVHHQAILGLMPAMTMEFAVSTTDARLLHSGDNIKADLVILSGTPARLEHIWPNERQLSDILTTSAKALREDTNDRGVSAYREVGEIIPNFSLLNQDGKIVESDHFRGKQIMLNFIYTRCPIADMCPLATTKMMATQKLANSNKVSNIEFISISLDPENDTPGVLKEYATARGIDTSNFTFLTGPQGAIRDLLTQFGVIAEFSGDLVKHTLVTLLINSNGKIIWRADGSAWEPQDFTDRMRKDLAPIHVTKP